MTKPGRHIYGYCVALIVLFSFSVLSHNITRSAHVERGLHKCILPANIEPAMRAHRLCTLVAHFKVEGWAALVGILKCKARAARHMRAYLAAVADQVRSQALYPPINQPTLA